MQLIANKEDYYHKEALYIKLRDAEGRIISKTELMQLPYLPAASTHYQEWKLRAKNFEKLKTWLRTKANKTNSLSILEVGCGNGWLSHRLSEEGHTVTGLDLNLTELEQAEATFGTSDRLQWIYADILKDKLPQQNFDVILFAASIQYFADVQQVKDAILALLKPGGEVHLYDSIFYQTDKVAAAKNRTIAYYTQLGYPAMAGYYHHHDTASLTTAGFKEMKRGLFAPKQVLQWWWLQK